MLIYCKKSLKYTGTVSYVLLILISSVFIYPNTLSGQTSGGNYVLLISGIGGETEYSEQFFGFLSETHKAFTDSFNIPPGNIVILAEKKYQSESIVNDVSTGENIRAKFNEFAGKITSEHNVFIILFGHGSFDGKNAKLNIPRRDLNETDYAGLVNSLNAGRIIFINTASSSFPFINALSGQNRIIITATSSPTQRNYTVFPGYLVDGFSDPASDFDKNGRLSVLEIFKYAVEKTERFFSDENHLATEFSMLEDNGDKKAYRLKNLQKNGEGALAEITWFNSRTASALLTGSAEQDSLLANLIKDQEKAELDISKLKRDKDKFSEKEYYEKLEKLLIKLAELTENIEKFKSGRQ